MTKAHLIDHQNGTFCVDGAICFATTNALYSQGVARFSNMDSVTISFAKTAQIDSSVLSLMLGWLRFAKKENKKIRYTDIPEHLHNLIQVSELQAILRTE